jgi:hypothetical protein
MECFQHGESRKRGKGRHSLIVGGRSSHVWLPMEASADRRSELHEIGMLRLQLLEGYLIAFQVGFENASHLVFKLLSLVAMMQNLDALLESDGNEKADRDGRNVYEEVFPSMDRRMGCVDFEHRC